MSIFIDSFEVDVAITEESILSSEISPYPVESGADKTDHIRNLPDTLNVECIVSDSPNEPMASRRGVTGVPPFSIPSQDCYEFLKELRAKREPFTVICHLGVFESMFIADLSAPKEAKEGLRFRATFKRLDIVSTERTTVLIRAAGRKRGSRASKSSPGINEVAADQGLTTKEFRDQYGGFNPLFPPGKELGGSGHE